MQSKIKIVIFNIELHLTFISIFLNPFNKNY